MRAKLLKLLLKKFTNQKMDFFIKNFFSKFDQIHTHLLKKSLTENFIFFCAVFIAYLIVVWQFFKTYRLHNLYQEFSFTKQFTWILVALIFLIFPQVVFVNCPHIIKLIHICTSITVVFNSILSSNLLLQMPSWFCSREVNYDNDYT